MKGRREEEERKRMQRLSFRKSKERGKERMKGSGVTFFSQQMGMATGIAVWGAQKSAQFISRRSRPTSADATCHAPSRKYYSPVTTYHNTPNQFHLPMQTCQGSFHCSSNASIAEPCFFIATCRGWGRTLRPLRTAG